MIKKMRDEELRGKAPAIVAVMRALSVRDAERAKKNGADMLELRIDLLNDKERDGGKIKEFISMRHMPLIVTNRRRAEGGSFTGTEEERIALLSSILETAEVDFVDLELSSPPAVRARLVELAQGLQIPIIFSFHDFRGMPPRAELVRIVTSMYEEGGSIAKIAVTPQTLSDALLMLNLTDEIAREGKLFAAIGMGPIGRHLRVVAPLYGSVLTYGFIEGEEEVAPGQFSVKELRSILDRLMLK
ncbi:MAG: type I 3-dehydroquinate dehydratase [Methanophagales archaeon ANME-1-THS]|nr:MAG: type I 3-dehydroquinate dehydratase [Methanophagales archaeon ANME-1-THS]